MQETNTAKTAPQSGWGAPQLELTLPGGRAVNPWLTLLALMFGFFMSLLDATIVNIALTAIQKDLNADLTTVSWVLSAYNLVFATLLVTMGRFADQWGRKRVFMIGMVLFSLGSLLCAIAPSIGWLIGFRAVQALGAAALNPISLAIITVVFPAQKRSGAIAVWGAMAGLAAAIGPVLGGFLVEAFDWRWIFFVNIPFCVIGLFMVYRFVPESRDANATRAIDIPGLVTLTAGMFCLVLAIIQGNDWGWTSGATLGLLAASVISFVLFFVVETRQKQPILDLSLFKLRNFSTANISIFMFSVAIQGAFLILVLYFINTQGKDELGAAYALLPLPLASFFVAAASARLGNRFSPRILGMVGLFVVALGLGSLATLGPDAGYFDTAWRAALTGIGMAFCFTTFPNLAISDVPRNKLGVSSGAFNTCRQIGFALGVAILISIFSGQIKDNVAAAASRAADIVQKNEVLPQPVRQQIISNLQASSQNSSFGRGSSSNQFDLTTLADRIPNGQALKPELAKLNGQIAAEFRKASTDAFDFTWMIAAIIALVGVIPAMFAKSPKPQPQSEHGNAPVAIEMA